MVGRKLTLEELPPVMLALSGIAGIGPMGIYRLFQGDFVIALVDAFAVTGFVLIAWSVYVKRAVRIASICMALVAVTAAVTSVSIKGGSQVVWMYPALVALFYLMKPKEAAVAAVVAIAIVLPVIFDGRPVGESAAYLASFGVTICLSVAFAALTAEQRRELHTASLSDALTGVGNRRALDDTLDRAIAVAPRTDDPFVLIMLDIDHFKSVNDAHGHTIGDRVLAEIAQTIQGHARPTDACFRAGGEEFVIVASASSLVQAQKLAERLRVAITELEFPATGATSPFGVTASFGLAEHRAGETRDALYKRADDALYEAKRSGRNRLHISERTASLSGTATHEALMIEDTASTNDGSATAADEAS
ncbi:MAG: GGDEF domain-containing protein [Pseudomonadota bacterium]